MEVVYNLIFIFFFNFQGKALASEGSLIIGKIGGSSGPVRALQGNIADVGLFIIISYLSVLHKKTILPSMRWGKDAYGVH